MLSYYINISSGSRIMSGTTITHVKASVYFTKTGFIYFYLCCIGMPSFVCGLCRPSILSSKGKEHQ